MPPSYPLERSGTLARVDFQDVPGETVATGVVALLLVWVPVCWRFTRHLVTIAHEGGHGVVFAHS